MVLQSVVCAAQTDGYGCGYVSGVQEHIGEIRSELRWTIETHTSRETRHKWETRRNGVAPGFVFEAVQSAELYNLYILYEFPKNNTIDVVFSRFFGGPANSRSRRRAPHRAARDSSVSVTLGSLPHWRPPARSGG